MGRGGWREQLSETVENEQKSGAVVRSRKAPQKPAQAAGELHLATAALPRNPHCLRGLISGAGDQGWPRDRAAAHK